MVEPANDFPDFTRGILLLGVDGDGNQVGVLLDAAGNLNCILKGQGATGLQTLAVDENGRIETFILDAESQWGSILRIGNAELASRLGAPTAWDGRGQVLILTDFSSGWPSTMRTIAGTGAASVISPDMFQRGGYSMKLTGGSDGGGYAFVSMRAAPSPAERTGIAMSFACSDTPDYVMLSITYQYDNAGYRARVRIDFDGGQIQVYDHLGAYNNVQAVSPYADPRYWHSFKFVVDLAAGEYERVLLDEVEVDITAYKPVTLGAGVELLTSAAYIYSHAGDNDYMFVDSMVLTTLEPANA